MTNSWLLLSGIGMMLVGIILPIYWWRSKKVSVKYFAFGAAIWVLAIAPKIIMDLTISPSLSNYLLAYGTEIFVITYGLYVGIRTGLFESGFTFIVALKTKLKEVNLNQAIAFGLGFGCFEAFIIGVGSFLSILTFAMMPDLINQIPPEQAEILIASLNQSTWIVPAAIIERISTIFIHVFCSLLVFYAIKIAHKKYLWYSIGFKTVVDGIIPALQVYVGTQTILSVYLMELPFISFGLLATGGIIWIKRQWRTSLDA